MSRLVAVLALVAVRGSGAATLGGGISAWLSFSGGSTEPASPCLGALWDFDGTLCQSEHVHRTSFGAVLGVELSEEHWYANCVGNSPRAIMEQHLPDGRLQPGETIDDLLQRRGELFEEHIAAGRLEPTPGAVELVRALNKAGVRCAIISSGNRGYIEKALSALKLDEAFEFILAGDDDDCVQHKPHPFPYLEGARRLGLKPEDCIAFEDSLSGLRSAQAAGMRVFGVCSPVNGHCEVLTASEACVQPDPLPEGAPLRPLCSLVPDLSLIDRSILMLPRTEPQN